MVTSDNSKCGDIQFEYSMPGKLVHTGDQYGKVFVLSRALEIG